MSDSEGLSRASLEASYFNCKLILSNIDVHNEFFSDYALIVNSFSELSDKLTLISNEQILLNPGFPFSCKSVNIELKFNQNDKVYGLSLKRNSAAFNINFFLVSPFK